MVPWSIHHLNWLFLFSLLAFDFLFKFLKAETEISTKHAYDNGDFHQKLPKTKFLSFCSYCTIWIIRIIVMPKV